MMLATNQSLPGQISQQLLEQYQSLRSQSLAAINASENRDYLCLHTERLYLDARRHVVNRAIFANLLALLQQRDFVAKRQQLFEGEMVNITENRAALHWALRTPVPLLPKRLGKAGEAMATEVATVLQQMRRITQQLQQQQWLGATGRAIAMWCISASVVLTWDPSWLVTLWQTTPKVR